MVASTLSTAGIVMPTVYCSSIPSKWDGALTGVMKAFEDASERT